MRQRRVNVSIILKTGFLAIHRSCDSDLPPRFQGFLVKVGKRGISRWDRRIYFYPMAEIVAIVEYGVGV